MNPFFACGILLGIHTVCWFLVAIFKKRNDIADVAWGLGFLAITLLLYFTRPHFPALLIIYGAVILWAIRLSMHIGLRHTKKDEDFRYKNWRQAWGKSFYLRTFLQVFLLQGFFLYVIALPLMIAAAAHYPTPTDLGFGHILFTTGFLVWFTGFMLESVADYQLSAFQKTKQPGRIMQSGLWKYSRHPNYFGEILVWWGIFLMVLPLPYGMWAIVSPLTLTWLLAFVSGVPMLEKKYAGNPEFEAYRKRTPALIPWFPKN